MTQLTLDPSLLTTFLLVLARTTAWTASSPLTSSKTLPPQTRLAIGLALAIFTTPLARGTAPQDLGSFAFAALIQIGIGLGLGFLSSLVLTAVEAAGHLADLGAGFSMGTTFDPVTGKDAATLARFSTMVMLTLLFATDGASTMVAGFVRSFAALPLDRLPTLSGSGVALLGHAAAQLTAAGVQIGAPVIGVSFLTDFGLGLMARFVPQASPLQLAMPIKALAGLAAFGTMLTLLPMQLDTLVNGGLQLGGRVFS
ncbi:MAG: fliR [Mycobacterium sp.]|jgi:flagellar biosynthetic protein FliR|nr:fliR [Mycobacterium sp.]MCW2744654.1 fliR [Mycobacterium sp.]